MNPSITIPEISRFKHEFYLLSVMLVLIGVGFASISTAQTGYVEFNNIRNTEGKPFRFGSVYARSIVDNTIVDRQRTDFHGNVIFELPTNAYHFSIDFEVDKPSSSNDYGIRNYYPQRPCFYGFVSTNCWVGAQIIDVLDGQTSTHSDFTIQQLSQVDFRVTDADTHDVLQQYLLKLYTTSGQLLMSQLVDLDKTPANHYIPLPMDQGFVFEIQAPGYFVELSGDIECGYALGHLCRFDDAVPINLGLNQLAVIDWALTKDTAFARSGLHIDAFSTFTGKRVSSYGGSSRYLDVVDGQLAPIFKYLSNPWSGEALVRVGEYHAIFSFPGYGIVAYPGIGCNSLDLDSCDPGIEVLTVSPSGDNAYTFNVALQQGVQGVVKDMDTLEPLEGVLIDFNGSVKRTNAQGRFEFVADVGRYYLATYTDSRHADYQNVLGGRTCWDGPEYDGLCQRDDATPIQLTADEPLQFIELLLEKATP